MDTTLFLGDLKNALDHWQTLVGAFVGATIPFLLWGYIEWHNKRKKRKEYLYYLQRVIVDQINLLIEVKETTQRFLDLKLKTLLNNIDNNPVSAYSVDTAFFPLFSVRPLPGDVNTTSSDSGYVDNKVAKIYALSKDFPHIIDDIRLQLRETLKTNEKIAFGERNSPEDQKKQFKRNIQGYEKMIIDDLLGKSIPLYFKKLAETLVAVEKKAKMSSIAWRIKFDPRWRFYIKKSSYLKAREQIMDNMDAYFEPARKIRLEKIIEVR